MLVEVKRNGSWRCLSNPRQREWVEQLPEFSVLLEAVSQLSTTLKDNHRSRVLLGELNSKQVVAKQPRNKNKRLWARMLSYIEPSEAAQTLLSLERFHRLGLASVQPLFVLEKRRFGAVVDSWLCYEYRHGRVCTKECLPEVIALLTKMHALGFRHNDPNFGNFLIDPEGQMFMLDCKGRARMGTFSDATDYFLLKKVNKKLKGFEVSDVAHLDQRSIGFRLAKLYNGIRSIRSKIKDVIKKNRLKNTES